MGCLKQGKIVDYNYPQISSKPFYKGITTSVTLDIEVWGKYYIMRKSDKKVQI